MSEEQKIIKQLQKNMHDYGDEEDSDELTKEESN